VLAAREGELADNAAVLRLLRVLRRERALTELPLGPLDPRAIAELLRTRGLAADAGQVHAQSSGNPLLALEMGLALAEGRPLLSGENALAVRASVQAAQQAIRIFAGQEALSLAQQALPLVGALPRSERLRAQLDLLEVCVLADRRPERLEEVTRDLSQLVLQAESWGLSDVAADALHQISNAHYFQEDEQGALHGSLRGAEVARS